VSKILGERVLQVRIEEEMKHSYLDYAMSVIVGRALPDVRDGLKPVHRRILFAMLDLGNLPDRPYKKSARVVGDVFGKYHPHGEVAIYEALVRLAQDFSMRYMLVDGHGNFGSVDGDEAAASRYTEVRLARTSMEMLADIDKATVDFIDNFDGTLQEPTVLPSKLPNLLINGSSGIAVGMATNIPSHNLGEVIDGVVCLIDTPDCTIDDLIQQIPGPDFPTAGIIMGRDGIRQMYHTGKGAVIIRGKIDLEMQHKGGREQLIISELPYQVNKATLVEKIAELVRDRKVSGISDIRDETDRRGMRVVLELKREARPPTIIKQLYKHTQLQVSFGAIMLALLNATSPKVLDLKSILRAFLDHRIDVVVRRSRYELEKSKARQHILQGLQIALDQIDEVVNLIRSSKTVEIARQGLMEHFGLSEAQAQAILDMRLARLTGLERTKIDEELAEVTKYIAYLAALLADQGKIRQVIKEELLALKERFADPRRTRIEDQVEIYNAEDLIPEEKVVISVTADGYFKRIPMSSYRSQRRGGVGVFGVNLRKEDVVEDMFVCSTHQRVLFFSSSGRVCGVQAYEVPEGSRTDRGSPIRAFFSLNEEEFITTAIPIPRESPEDYIVMVTKRGQVKRVALLAFKNAGRRGIRAMGLREGDSLCKVRRTNQSDEMVLFTSSGLAAHFKASDLRPMGRDASGVRGIRLKEGDIVIGLEVLRAGCDLLVVSEGGYGKKCKPNELPLHKRGGRGVAGFRVRSKTGPVIGIRIVAPEDDVIVVTQSAKVIRINTKEIPTYSRSASGVRLVRVGDNERVAAVARVKPDENLEKEDDVVTQPSLLP
jgi:DNA gyrase subunit A